MNQYLSIHQSSKDNLQLLEKGVYVTKSYFDALQSLEAEALPEKIQSLKITAIAFFALGLLVSTLINFPVGMTIAFSAIFFVIGANYFKNCEIKKLELLDSQNELSNVFKQMQITMEEARKYRDEFVLRNVQSLHNKDKLDFVNDVQKFSDYYHRGNFDSYDKKGIELLDNDRGQQQSYIRVYKTADKLNKIDTPKILRYFSSPSWKALKLSSENLCIKTYDFRIPDYERKNYENNRTYILE